MHEHNFSFAKDNEALLFPVMSIFLLYKHLPYCIMTNHTVLRSVCNLCALYFTIYILLNYHKIHIHKRGKTYHVSRILFHGLRVGLHAEVKWQKDSNPTDRAWRLNVNEIYVVHKPLSPLSRRVQSAKRDLQGLSTLHQAVGSRENHDSCCVEARDNYFTNVT